VQSIVWAVVIAVAAVLLLALTLRVNAVKAQVRLTERRILATKQDKLSLETEFQTRANQQQLAAINAVEFGFKAPGAGQYLDGERQLAALSRPVAPAMTPGLPAPVRMARADKPAPGAMSSGGSLPAVLAPLKGQALTVGSGTRFLSDRHEVPAKLAARTPPEPADKPHSDKQKPRKTGPTRLALDDAPSRVSGKAGAKAAKQ
jgi:hypothetical protein